MFHLFQKKQNILDTGLLEGMTDIHTHFLPQVDDGSQSPDESLSALSFMQSIGIKRIYLTPHVMADYNLNKPEFLSQRFSLLEEKYSGGIELKLAGEYMLDSGFSTQQKEGLLTMAGKHVLVETSFLSPPPDLENMLYEIMLDDYTPIIAHPERYLYMDKKEYKNLKDKGYKFQMNLFSASGFYGHSVKERALFLLKENLYDFTGSDYHRLSDYERGLKELNLRPSLIDKLKELIANNNSLWQ